MSYPSMINGLLVVSPPAEIDVLTADRLRAVLLEAAANGHTTVVVDLTRTRFCDSSGLNVLAGAHRRAVDEGGGLRLVLPADGAVACALALTTLDGFIPCFPSLDQALASQVPPMGPRPGHQPPSHPGQPDGGERVAQGSLEASVAAGGSGPLIILAGEADLTSAGLLSALITGQFEDGTRLLTIDVSRLRFADSASVRTLLLAGKALKERGGSLVLLHPQRPVAKVLALLGADQVITILDDPRTMSGDSRWPASLLEVSVAAGESGRVVVLAGEADYTSVTQLSEVLDAELSGPALRLTVDVSELGYADSASVRTLAAAAMTLRDRGGNLVLLRPQPWMVSLLTLLHAEETLTIVSGTETLPGSDGTEY
jgi:anti-sigma B factor antagonist